MQIIKERARTYIASGAMIEATPYAENGPMIELVCQSKDGNYFVRLSRAELEFALAKLSGVIK